MYTDTLYAWAAGLFDGKARQCYTWEVYSKNGKREFLVQVMLYLQIKRKQAELALEFLDALTNRRYELIKLCCNLNGRKARSVDGFSV